MKKTLILSIILSVLISLDVLYACATCFGDPNSKATQGMNLAIITMLTVTGGVLSSFLSFVYILNKLSLLLLPLCILLRLCCNLHYVCHKVYQKN